MSSSEVRVATGGILRPTPADRAELHRFFHEISQPGATVEGGLNRLAASEEDGAARRCLCDWLSARGVEVRVDTVGNIFGLATWREGAPYILCGSHLDSQPTGGRYDGTYGVVCAAVAQQVIDRAMVQGGAAPLFNLAVVNWTNEEGARFVPSLLGSSVFIGTLAANVALAARDAAGTTLDQALAAIGFRGDAAVDLPVAAYAEIHVEQGTRLEAAGAQIGVVRSTWAALKLTVKVEGEQAHTGPTPMAERKDALLAAAQMISIVREIANDHPAGVVHSSVGRLHVYPNSSNVVPAEALAYVEFRSLDTALLEAIGQDFADRLTAIAEGTGTTITIAERALRAPARLDPMLGDLAHEVALAIGAKALDTTSVSGHDAIALAKIAPTLLLFVPSEGGVAHNVHEYTTPADLEVGLDALAAVLSLMCRGGGISLDVSPGAGEAA